MKDIPNIFFAINLTFCIFITCLCGTKTPQVTPREGLMGMLIANTAMWIAALAASTLTSPPLDWIQQHILYITLTGIVAGNATALFTYKKQIRQYKP